MSPRVVHVVCSDGFAGVERYLCALGPAQATAGADVVVVGGDGDRMRSALDGSGVAWLPGDSMARAARSLASARPEVVATHMTQADLVGAAVTLTSGTPLVSTLHFPADRGSSRPARLAGRWVASRCAAQIAVSDHVAGFVAGAETIHSGVADVADVVSAAGRERLVLTAQRLEVEKDTPTALRAWAGSSLRERGWRLGVAGRGAEEGRLRILVDELGIAGTVDFLGLRDDIADLFDRAALLLATAPTEAFGLSVVEAMAHGLPVLATAAGAHPETVGSATPETLFPAGDDVAAAALLDRLGDDVGDRERLAKLGVERQRSGFAVARQAEQTLAVYRRVLDR